MSVAGRAETGGDTCRTQSPGQTKAGYHAQIKAENRARIIRAARDLFLAQGYDKTSLAQIAKEARVSTGTLFKRYPSKAALFAAVTAEQWQLDVEWAAPPPPGDPRYGLDHIGRDYACLVARPHTAALCRLIITELPQMPELADIVGTGFAMDRGPFFDRLRDYLEAEAEAGTLDFRSADGQPQSASAVAEQFLGMISGQFLWPQLVRTDFVPPNPTDAAIVDEAVALMLARYGTGA
ncbi:TetR/AcrR family transcriptional regulator [Streptomyces sp. SP18BB07]|uniref:TetR/AcrR family transcriptional regulator n=1 Tax=Streptomyces sp. SP18BB07 TaxID=3002522 RepID=UPI002E7A2D85|nr:TetR/AcrR family transcriptional regulator [Streptomyces sp. SP18BB07]MEE1766426.1 TetR/AcrR family transcriptional regulator [Streptomyces sp. SP18BB07]